MIVLLKIILGLLAVADAFAMYAVFNDFRSTRNQDGYDELSIWRRLKFNFVSFMIMSGMLSLFVFLIYFIIINITLV